MATDTMQEVRKIFNMAQDGVTAPRLCEMLSPIQSNTDEEAFWLAFLNHVQKTMIFYKSETVVERVISFIAAFSTYASVKKNKDKEQELVASTDGSQYSEEEVMDPFLLKLMNFLVENHNARDKGVRYRCCQLINKLLSHLGDEDTIDEDVSDAIYECMMIRIKDKFPPIRIQAVLALVRLQDPSDEECPVIDAFIHSMETDTNADVRKTVLSNIALSRKTLPYVLGRIRDIKDQNRKVSFLTLAEKVSIRALTIAQRISILNAGLNDRSETVKQACVQLLRAWLTSYEHNVIKLLEALDTEGSTECSTLVIEALFKDSTIEKMENHVKALQSLAVEGGRVVSHDVLTPENVFYWFMICKHLKSLGDEGELLLQNSLPELTKFCEYIQSYAERNFIDSAILTAFEGKEQQSEFILETLLKISAFLDLSDEVGRKNLGQLIHNLLLTETIPIAMIPELVSRYADIETNEDRFIQALVETISEIKQPLVQVVTTAMKETSRRLELQIARVSMNLNECKEDLDNAIKGQNFQQAALLKDQISELQEQRDSLVVEKSKTEEQHLAKRVERDDPETMLRSLTLATAMLSKTKQKGLSSTLMTLKDELIFEGVKNEDPFIRNEAVKCLGHLSLLNKEFACQHLVLFLQVAQVDQESLQITAVQVIFDLFLIYGLEAFDMDSNDADKTKTENDTTVTNEVAEDIDTIEETPPENIQAKTNAAESVLGILLMFLESESPDLRTTVAEGLAKLLMSGRIVSAKILTRLILLWYNPITEDDTKLRHCLGVFLPVFAFETRKKELHKTLTSNIRNNQSLIEECFLPVIKTLFNAPPSSPLNKVNIANVIDLLLQLTDVRNLAQLTSNDTTKDTCKQFEYHVHDSIALKLANEILSDPEDSDVRLLCKTLNQLHLCANNVTVINDLLEVNVKMLEALSNNRTAKKMIEKFQLYVQSLFVQQGPAEMTVDEPTLTNETTTVAAETSTNNEELIKKEEDEEDKDSIDMQSSDDRTLVVANDDNNEDDDDDDDADDEKPQDDILNASIIDIGASALQKQQTETDERGSKKHKLSTSGGRRERKRTKLNNSVDFGVHHNVSLRSEMESARGSDSEIFD